MWWHRVTQDVTGLNPFTALTNIVVTELNDFKKKFRENSNGILNL